MKTTRTLLLAATLSAVLPLTATSASAALQTRLGGLALYDTDLDITWLANANVNGIMAWSNANAWATGLVVEGIGDWRLPATLASDPSCTSPANSSGYLCTGSELGHLFYSELGGAVAHLISGEGHHNANLGLFQNLQDGSYWSGSEYSTGHFWALTFYGGLQGIANTGWSYYALAVHDGDVAAVPVPAAVWLLGSGLLGLAGVARRKSA